MSFKTRVRTINNIYLVACYTKVKFLSIGITTSINFNSYHIRIVLGIFEFVRPVLLGKLDESSEEHLIEKQREQYPGE